MIISKISDGLGNQLFQYALGRSLSYKHNRLLKLGLSAFTNNYTLRDYQLGKYKIIENKLTFSKQLYYKILCKIIIVFKQKNKILKFFYWENKQFSFDESILNSESSYFFGYWQTFKYFKDIRHLLLKELELKENLNLENSEMLKNIKKTNSISLHIRRGDYLKIKHQNVCDLSYYERAVNKMIKEIENPSFFIFSDDIKWVKENLKVNHPKFFIDFNQNNPEYDLELMKNCKHNIIANSTFSWWGAWLNAHKNKIVILPKEWRKDFPIPIGLIEDGWILL